jgi:hypothetical protein
MKIKILFFMLILSGAISARCQCVIYADDKTGAFGAGYNNDNMPTTFRECEDVAKNMCREKGGNSCTELYRSSKKGWWGIINGQKSDGRNYFQGGDGYSSKTEAENAVRAKYKADGGLNAGSIPVYTWYSYSNVKN